MKIIFFTLVAALVVLAVVGESQDIDDKNENPEVIPHRYRYRPAPGASGAPWSPPAPSTPSASSPPPASSATTKQWQFQRSFRQRTTRSTG
uniref:Putative secreted protein n=1 Tax=Panstrongylus lignarius TaxID=156445 RepID=A0A224XYS8_9HEMI